MSDGPALLRAVCEQPADDAPRLVYADWLDENGQPERAEFIRLQCLLADPEKCPTPGCLDRMWHAAPDAYVTGMGVFTKRCRCAYCQIRRREWRIWQHWGCEWMREYLQPMVDAEVKLATAIGIEPELLEAAAQSTNLGRLLRPTDCDFERGLVARIELPMRNFLDHATTLFARFPITAVKLTDAVIHPSGGNDTYYVGNLGAFPPKYWSALDGFPSRAVALDTLNVLCVRLGRSLAGLPPLA